MTFDIKTLRNILDVTDKVARVVIADIKGSSPREVGAAMLVWADGQSGTIGGGALEYDATKAARRLLAGDKSKMTRHALGPDLGQCCGGHVSLLTEVFDNQTISALPTDTFARPVAPDTDMPFSVKRLLSRMRNQGQTPAPQLLNGWMIEPILRPTRPIWIWGAGHVGRALVDVLAPLPDLDITWIDTNADRFPLNIRPQITVIAQKNPSDIATHAPAQAEHFILTYSHALDLELCHRLLLRGFVSAGLIGSKTKWARFRKRLGELGHAPEQVARITCPIGDPALGKHPTQIAIGVARDLITPQPTALTKEHRA